MTDGQLQALGIEFFHPAAPGPVPGDFLVNVNPAMIYQPLHNMPGAQEVAQADGELQLVQRVLAPALANLPPVFGAAASQQAILPQPLRLPQQPAQPVIPGPQISNRRKRCYPCHHGSKQCDRLDQIAAAQANGVDTVANPVCCSNCERKTTGQAGFQASYCVIDPATSLNAGFQEYLDGWAAKRARR